MTTYLKAIRNKVTSSLKYLKWLAPFSLVNILFHSLLFILCVSIVIIFSLVLFTDISRTRDYLIVLGFLAAALTLTYNVRRHLSEDYFKEAREQLQKAFEILNVYDADGRLSNDRLRWLTAARTLLIAERIGRKIMMSSHKEINIEDRQFWRMKFHGIVSDFSEDFYAEEAVHMIHHRADVRSPISEASLVIIHEFIDWDESYADPLKRELFSDEKLDLLDRHYPNMVRVLRTVRRLRVENYAGVEAQNR